MLPPPAIMMRLDRRDHPSQLAHHRANMLGGGKQEDLVTGLDDRIASGEHRLVATEDRGDPRIHVRPAGTRASAGSACRPASPPS